MNKIKLNKGMYVTIDSEDFEYLNQWKWFYEHGYARREVQIDNKRERIYMHQVVNNTPKGFLTDHINRNKLDNRKCNLRTVDKRGNSMNLDLLKNNTSGYRGVTWFKRDKTWKAQIRSRGKNYHLGYFKDIQDAVKSRKEGEKVHFNI